MRAWVTWKRTSVQVERRIRQIEFNGIIHLTVINLAYTKRCCEVYIKSLSTSSLWFNWKVRLKQFKNELCKTIYAWGYLPGMLEFKRENHKEIEGNVPFLLEDFYILVGIGRWYRTFKLIRNHPQGWNISGFVIKMKWSLSIHTNSTFLWHC